VSRTPAAAAGVEVSRGSVRAAAALVAVLLLATVGVDGWHARSQASTVSTVRPHRPNIVFVLTDDLSYDIAVHMSQVRAMGTRGTSFPNYVVTDSLCCPSRASILTGLMPHNTKVRTNKGPRGGYASFIDPNRDGSFADNSERSTFATRLHDGGYRTGFVGKYLNGYPMTTDLTNPVAGQGPTAYRVPPGWDEWHVAANGYREFRYRLTRAVDGTKRSSFYRGRYLTDVLAARAQHFIHRARTEHPRQPFFLEVATFSPHSRVKPDPNGGPLFPAARRDRPGALYAHGDCGGVDCATLTARNGQASYDEPTGDKPRWVPRSSVSGAAGQLTTNFRDRVRMVQSINDLLARLRSTLAAEGVTGDTYVVFSSDNGFHLGQHRLRRGKGTPYETDIRVPLVVTGPGVRVGRRREEVVQNIDLSATFQQMAGLDVAPGDGRGLRPLLRGRHPAWREAALVEHVHTGAPPGDPDGERSTGQAPTYDAIRTANEMYARYRYADGSGQEEYYDLRKDPEELRATLRLPPGRAALGSALDRLRTCGSGGTSVSCWQAGQLDASR